MEPNFDMESLHFLTMYRHSRHGYGDHCFVLLMLLFFLHKYKENKHGIVKDNINSK